MANPKCELPGCGLDKKWFNRTEREDWGYHCPRNADAHALAAKLAESEAKVKELEAKLAEVQKLHKRDYNRSWAAKREAEIVSLKAEWNIMRREGYQAAMILAHNLCAQVSDEHDADDEILQRNGASNCTYRIKGWLNPSDNEIMQLVAESEPARDALAREASRKKGAEHAWEPLSQVRK